MTVIIRALLWPGRADYFPLAMLKVFLMAKYLPNFLQLSRVKIYQKQNLTQRESDDAERSNRELLLVELNDKRC